jgi:signal transduction histidine kinase
MIGNVILLGLTIIAILYGANAYFFSVLQKNGALLNLPPDHVYFQLIHEQKALMNTIFIATAIGVNLLIYGWGVVVSNRIAGPIYRLCKHINEVVNGETDRDLSFREKDYFPEVAEEFNKIMVVIRNESKTLDSNSRKKAKSV